MGERVVEGWGVVQSRERILIAYLAAAVDFADCCNKLSNLCVSGTPVFRCLRKTYCIIVPIYIFLYFSNKTHEPSIVHESREDKY